MNYSYNWEAQQYIKNETGWAAHTHAHSAHAEQFLEAQVTRPTLQVMWTHMEHKVKSQKSYF